MLRIEGLTLRSNETLSVSCMWSHYETRSFSNCADADQIIGCTTTDCPSAVGNMNCDAWYWGSSCYIRSYNIEFF